MLALWGFFCPNMQDHMNRSLLTDQSCEFTREWFVCPNICPGFNHSRPVIEEPEKRSKRQKKNKLIFECLYYQLHDDFTQLYTL